MVSLNQSGHSPLTSLKHECILYIVKFFIFKRLTCCGCLQWMLWVCLLVINNIPLVLYMFNTPGWFPLMRLRIPRTIYFIILHIYLLNLTCLVYHKKIDKTKETDQDQINSVSIRFLPTRRVKLRGSGTVWLQRMSCVNEVSSQRVVDSS